MKTKCVCYQRGDYSFMEVVKGSGYEYQYGTFADHMYRPGAFLVFALHEEKPVGYIMATSTIDGTYVHSVNVLEALRSKGIGLKMFVCLEMNMRARKHDKPAQRYPISLHCNAENKNAVALYKKVGFHVTSRTPNVWEPGQIQLIMRKNARH